jgi:hypothetical protein
MGRLLGRGAWSVDHASIARERTLSTVVNQVCLLIKIKRQQDEGCGYMLMARITVSYGCRGVARGRREKTKREKDKEGKGKREKGNGKRDNIE